MANPKKVRTGWFVGLSREGMWDIKIHPVGLFGRLSLFTFFFVKESKEINKISTVFSD